MLRKMLVLPLACLLFSCSDRGYSLLTVLTDQKDMILISEYYNSIQDSSRLRLIYDDYISLEDILAHNPDLVIGKDMNNPLFYEQFVPLIPPEGIYPVLVGEKDEDGRTGLLPLAFDMPLIVYSRDLKGMPLMMTGNDLKRVGAAGNREEESQYTHMGFSPLWKGEFLYWYMKSLNISFYRDGEFRYDQSRLDEGIGAIRAWVDEENGGLEKEKAFSDKYRYIPDYKLLQQGIIDFSAMKFSEYSGLPGKETARMTYSWFGDGENISPADCLYGGILAESEHEERSREFLYWLLSEEGQKELIHYKGVVSPGFALFDRFSSLERINRLFLPLTFSDKLGLRIFMSEQLGPPLPEPENWSAVKENVIFPWLEETLWENGALTLASYYREWQLHFID